MASALTDAPATGPSSGPIGREGGASPWNSPQFRLILFKLLACTALLTTAFAAGVEADRHGWLTGSRRQAPPGAEESFGLFWEAWQLVQDHYVDRDATAPARLTRGAIDGMVRSLGDTGHSTYLTASDLGHLMGDLAGQAEGVGVILTTQERRPTIASTQPGSPARAAGLCPGDALLAVDDVDVSELPLPQVIAQVRGPAGTSVRLRVWRPGAAAHQEFCLTRARVEVPSVVWQLLPDLPIAHVAVRHFAAQTADELRQALREGRARGAKGVVLDLRGNPGGLREQAIAVASEFLGDGVVLQEVDVRSRQTAVPVRPGGVAVELPLVVLVDRGTASSAEIVAAALQDHERALVVGTRTFGTGTIVQPFRLSDGSAVLLGVAKWLTPRGRQLWQRGLTPDVPADLPPGATALAPDVGTPPDAAARAMCTDLPFLAALETLAAQLP